MNGNYIHGSESHDTAVSEDPYVSVWMHDDIEVAVVLDERCYDIERILEIDRQLQRIALANKSQKLLVDLGNLQWASAFMIGKLVTLNRNARRNSVRVKMFNSQTVLKEVLELVDVNRWSELCVTLEDAHAAFERERQQGEVFAQRILDLRRSADVGNAEIQMQLGEYYEQAVGLKDNFTHAFLFYLAAADQGHLESQTRIGRALRHGVGVELDQESAMRWFTKAAEAGSADAKYLVGFGYRTGQGCISDDTQAANWLQLAADQGHEEARVAVAQLVCD